MPPATGVAAPESPVPEPRAVIGKPYLGGELGDLDDLLSGRRSDDREGLYVSYVE